MTAELLDLRADPLAGFEPGAAGERIMLARAAPCGILNLRSGDPASLSAALEAVPGPGLPEAANTVRAAAGIRVAWLAPDEWLCFCPPEETDALQSRLRSTCGDDDGYASVDLSHGYTGFVLAGPAAGAVLAKGCPLDLHPRAFADGACAQSLLALTRVLVLRDGGRFELRVRNSYARYLAAWLTDAAAEFLG